MRIPNLVVGSGPSAAACTRALLDRGHRVVMIDAGLDLDPQVANRVSQIARAPVTTWREQLRDVGGDRSRPNYRGLPEKLVFGSDYPFRHLDAAGPITQHGADTFWSFALGGLSNVWGANTLPFHDSDLKAWPFRGETLAPFYREVLRYVPLAGAVDELAEWFPTYTTDIQPLRPSAQAAALLERWRAARTALTAAGVTFGQSRLAVRTQALQEKPGCVYCGSCLYGCPHHLIWSSAFAVRDLRTHSRFTYHSSVIVERVVQEGSAVTVTGRSTTSGELHQWVADRVFVGCGAVNSTRIALQSREIMDEELLLKDSQYFMIPFVMERKARGVRNLDSHGLSQLCMEISDPSVSANSVHLLLYTFNDLFLRALDTLPGPARVAVSPFRDALLDRLGVIQGYLHSDDSASLAVSVKRHGNGFAARVRGVRQPGTVRVIDVLLGKLRRMRRLTGVRPLGFMRQIGAPGKSYHVGGSLPMRLSPGRMETDIYGRVADMNRVHFIDPATFPSMPAANSTLTAMANACRIGAAAADL